MEQAAESVQLEKIRRDKARNFAAALSFSVGLAILVLKWLAYLWTGSAALFSDAVESITHVVATAVVWWAMRYSLAPPDEEHPYGHGKAEYVSVGFEGGLVFLAGVAILWHVYELFLHGSSLGNLEIGMYFSLAAMIVNIVLGLYLLYAGKRWRSPLLVADGKHVLSDVITTLAIFIGILAVYFTGWLWLDWFVAVLAALWLMYVAIGMVRESFGNLVDEVDMKILKKTVEVINQYRQPEFYDVHNLRVHCVGDYAHIDFHLVLPQDWTVRQSHDISELLEEKILEGLDRPGTVIIHMDIDENPQPRELDFTLEEAIEVRYHPTAHGQSHEIVASLKPVDSESC